MKLFKRKKSEWDMKAEAYNNGLLELQTARLVLTRTAQVLEQKRRPQDYVK